MSNVMTPVFRVSYPNVLKPKLNKLNNKEEYSVVALFPKGTNLDAMKKAAQAAIVEKWGADQKKWPKNLRTPFRKHEEKVTETDDGKKLFPAGMEEGGIFMNLKSKQRPGVVNQKTEDIINESDFYAGCFARATVRCFAYYEAGNAGVSFGLQNIQKVKEGDPLGSRTRAQDDFAPIAVAEEGSVESAADASSLFD